MTRSREKKARGRHRAQARASGRGRRARGSRARGSRARALTHDRASSRHANDAQHRRGPSPRARPHQESNSLYRGPYDALVFVTEHGVRSKTWEVAVRPHVGRTLGTTKRHEETFPPCRCAFPCCGYDPPRRRARESRATSREGSGSRCRAPYDTRIVFTGSTRRARTAGTDTATIVVPLNMAIAPVNATQSAAVTS